MTFFQLSHFHTEHNYFSENNFSLCEENLLKVIVNKTVREFQIWRLDESKPRSQQTDLLVREISPNNLNLIEFKDEAKILRKVVRNDFFWKKPATEEFRSFDFHHRKNGEHSIEQTIASGDTAKCQSILTAKSQQEHVGEDKLRKCTHSFGFFII